MDQLSKVYDVGLFDLDGVTYLGAEPIEHAAKEIQKALAQGFRHVYVTNNASRPAADVAAQLASLGFPAEEGDVLTSAHVAAAMILEQFGASARVLAIGGAGLRNALADKGLTTVASADDNPDVVVQGFSPDISWVDLSEAALAIRGGATYIATNMDKVIPRERGLMIGNGALISAVAISTGVTPQSAGKPEPEIFHKAAQSMDARKPLFIGDNLDTDIQGAVSAGIDSLHVLTGLATARQICLARPEVRPTYLCDDLRGLNESYPQVLIEGARVTVDDAVAEWSQGRFELSIGGERLDVSTDAVLGLSAYRALAHAAWLAADSGAELGPALGEITVVRS